MAFVFVTTQASLLDKNADKILSTTRNMSQLFLEAASYFLKLHLFFSFLYTPVLTSRVDDKFMIYPLYSSCILCVPCSAKERNNK